MGVKRKTQFYRLVLPAIAVALFAVLLSPLDTNAAIKPMNPKEEADSWIRYKQYEKCAADSKRGITTFDQVKNYDWFMGNEVAVGYLNSGSANETGTGLCNDKGALSQITSYWGFGDAVPAWCNAMQFAGPYRDGTDRNCNGGDGNFLTGGPDDANPPVDPSTSFKRAVEQGFYKVGSEQAIWDNMSKPAKYWLYYQSFVNLCHAKPVVAVSQANDTQKDMARSDLKAYQIRWANPTSGNVEDWIFQGDGDQKKTDRVGIFEDEGAGGNPTCGEISLWLGDNADDFVKYAKKTGFGIPTAPEPVTDPGDPDGAETKSSCGVKGGMGWVICPVMQFLGDAVDYMYSFIADQLEVPIKMFDMSSGTYTAWTVFRDYANVAFIIAFLFIVYSQVTSVGISNYGIKKMLPKLIIGAILVNTSFFICQFAVDLTNLLGQGITHLFDGIANTVSKGASLPVGASGADGGGNFGKIIATALIGGAIIVIALALGLLGPILLAVALVFLILLLRKVLIIILIAISPLAFVAYLLPNTEKWFKKWSDMFMKVLMVFPVVAIVIGASRVASAIISQQTSTVPGNTGEEVSSLVNGLIAAAVLTVPFFVIPGLLSKSLEAMGSFGKKLSNASQKANGRVGSQAKKRGGEIGKTVGRRANLVRSSLAKRGGIVGAVAGRKSRRDFRRNATETATARNYEEGIARDIQRNPDSNKYTQQQKDNAAAVTAKRRDEDVGARTRRLQSEANNAPDSVRYLEQQMNKAIQAGDANATRAAMAALKSSGEGGVEAIQRTIAHHESNKSFKGNTGNDLRQFINESHSDLKSSDARITSWAGNGNAATRQASIEQTNFSGLTDKQIASQTGNALNHASASGALDPTTKARIHAGLQAGTIETKQNKAHHF